MKAIRKFTYIGLVLIMSGLFSSCVTPGSTTPSTAGAPLWWEDTHKHDQSHLYFKAKGKSAVSLEDARANAIKSIKGQMATYIQSAVEVGSQRIDISSRFELREVEAFKESEPLQRGGNWIVYILGRYPRSEYDKIRAKIELADKLAQNWSAAQSAVNRGKFATAEPQLLSIISQYDQALSPGFAVEDVKLTLAGLYLKQEFVLKAGKWIQDVRKSTSEPGWRSRAKEMERNLPEISLRDAFGAKKVALFCCVRDAQPVRLSPELLEEASSRLAKAGVPGIQITSQDVASEAQFFNGGNAAPLLAQAKAVRADVVVTILLAVDPAKTGKKVDVPGGGQTDALDATLYYYVIRVSDGQVLCSDKTLGLSQGSVPFAAKSLLNMIFTHRNHLRKYSATIAESL